MKTPTDMIVGSLHKTNLCGVLVVVDYRNADEVLVRFNETGYERLARAKHIRKGKVSDPFARKVCGVGYIGIGDYSKTSGLDHKRIYSTWNSMLERCYSNKSLAKNPTYRGCSVCDEWQCLQSFAKWMIAQDYKNKELDKDIKVSGNKVYSPITCLFVSRSENTIAAHAKFFTFKSPSGEIVKIYNLSEFCRKNNLNIGNMSSVNRSKKRSHKGFTKA